MNSSLIYFSQDVERLAEFLSERLYQDPNPFKKRVIIIPHPAMKFFLMEVLSHRFGVVAGLEIIPLHVGPSFLELSLYLEGLLSQFLEEASFAPVRKYLKDQENRLSSLADHLTQLFLEYSNAHPSRLKNWLTKKGWQQTLWKKINQKWTFPFKPLEQEADVHVFGFTYLAESHFEFFLSREAKIYLFSPCQFFWGDYYSDKEQERLLRSLDPQRKKILKQTFEEQNSLLSNLGKLGRKMQLAIEEKEIPTLEDYPPISSDTLLAHIQKDLLEGQVSKGSFDDSVQVVSASTKWREVELLKSKLTTWLQEHPEATPRDILVLAPDISQYAPFVEAVFEASDGLEATLFDLPLNLVDPYIQAFEQLLSITFERDDLLELFSHPLFMAKQNLTASEVQRLAFWSKKASIRSNWEEGLWHLIEGLLEETPFSCIEPTEIELFDKFYRLIKQLQKDLAPIREEKKKSLSAWGCTLTSLFQTYISDYPHQLLSSLHHLEDFGHFKAQRILEKLFTQPSGSKSSPHLHVVRMMSLKKGVAHPAKLIYCLGMEEGSFPKLRQRSSLFEPELEGPQTSVEEDRTLFLELLFSAKKSLIFSFTSQTHDASEEVDLSLSVQELLSFLNQAYDIQIPIEHHSEEVKSPLAIPQRPFATSPSELLFIDLKNLNKLAKNPIKFFLQEILRLYPVKEETDNALWLNPLQKYNLSKQSLSRSLEEVVKQAEKQGQFPVGLLKPAALNWLHKETEEQQLFFQEMGIKPSEFFSIELTPHCHTPQKLPNGDWLLPPLEIENVKFIGRLEEVTPAGLLFRTDDGFEELIKAWPLYLVYLNLPIPKTAQLLFLKKRKPRLLRVEDPKEALAQVIRYYSRASLQPSPLLPAFARALLLGTSKELEKAFTTDRFQDENWEWIQKSSRFQDPEKLFHEWAPFLREIYEPCIRLIS